jgi:hypothetical protein
MFPKGPPMRVLGSRSRDGAAAMRRRKDRRARMGQLTGFGPKA